MPEVVDLREEAGNRLALAAMGALRDLKRGESCVLLTREAPALLIASLNLQVRDAFAWESVCATGHWETLVRFASDAAPTDIVDRLVREHRVFDEQLGRTLRYLNSGDLPNARALIGAFSEGLRRHIHAENDVVAPTLGPAAGCEPLDIMLREHEDLLAQLASVEAALGGEAWELETFVALLSGTLAKHEYREEMSLFPYWRSRLAGLDAPARAAIEQRIAP